MSKLKNIPLGFTYAIVVLALVPGIGFYYCKMYGKQNSWLAMIISNILGLLFVKMTLAIRSYDKDKNIFEINKLALGEILGNMVNIIFCLVLALLMAILCWHSYIFLKSNFFNETPFFILGLGLFLPLLYISNKSNNVLLKTNLICFPLIVVLCFVAFFGLSFQADLKNLEPFQEVKTYDLLYNTFSLFSLSYLPTYAITALSDYQNKKGIFKSLLIATIINTGIVFFTYAVLGRSIIDMVDFSEFFVLRKIGNHTGGSRIDSFIILEWLICIFVIACTCLFFIRNYFKNQFKNFKNNYTFLILILLFFLSLNIFKNVTIGKLFVLNILPYICFFSLFLLNFIIFIILKIKKKPQVVSQEQ